MKKYFVMKIGSRFYPASANFINLEFARAIGEEVVDTIYAADMKSAFQIVNKFYSEG